MKQKKDKSAELKTSVEDMQKLLKELQEKSDFEKKDLILTLQRVQAEFENYKKRTDNEKQEFMKFANSSLMFKLLPIIDNFDLALQNKCLNDDFIAGIAMIHEQMVKILEDIGLKKIDAKDKEFNPYLHEALLQEKSDKDNIVLEELQKGYKLNDKVLRPVKVKIGKKD